MHTSFKKNKENEKKQVKGNKEEGDSIETLKFEFNSLKSEMKEDWGQVTRKKA